MKVYVAGSTKDIDNVRKAQHLLTSMGHTITFDWTDPVLGKIREKWGAHRNEAESHSTLERNAVREADAVVLIWPQGQDRAGTGSLLETGMGMGLGKRVVIVGGARESVFWYLPKVQRVASLWGLEEVMA